MNEWKRKIETKVYKWGWVAHCYSFIFSHIYSLSPSLSDVTLSHSHIRTVLPSILSPVSPAECCIIPSVGEGGQDGRMEGGRDGGEEGRERQQGEWLTMQHAPQRHTQLNYWNHPVPQSLSQSGSNFPLILSLFSFGWMFFAGFQCGNNSHWLIKLCSQLSKWCLNFNVLHACFVRNPIRSERSFLSRAITRIMNKRWDVWCHVVWKQIILTLEILHKRWLIVCVAAIIQESVNV